MAVWEVEVGREFRTAAGYARYVLGPVCWKGGITGNDMSLREMVDLVAKCDIAWHIQGGEDSYAKTDGKEDSGYTFGKNGEFPQVHG
ncbi:hypothetical protein EJ110_NYTH57732 [Nymphaea thermarum]|nr:hypothetical protein EJ110_NYTH57732 [Nymphaea thermarum]